MVQSFDTVETVLKFTASMTWKGIHPTVELVTTVYRTGVKLPKNDMALLENQFVRLPGLGKWFIDIAPTACRKV